MSSSGCRIYSISLLKETYTLLIPLLKQREIFKYNVTDRQYNRLHCLNQSKADMY